MRSDKERLHPSSSSSNTEEQLDGKIIGSRFQALTPDRPVATKTTKTKTTTSTTVDTFPEKLAGTLRSNHDDAIWWNPDGSVFAMMPQRFTEQVLDKVFQGTKLESFQRKMKRWGFER